MANSNEDKPIKIVIMALGGQGGGVLTNWIVDVLEKNGFVAQSTSVPGVAQRTGATIYYVEAIRKGTDGPMPVLALMPTAGDVDIVIASELMEAGRAILRGFVSPDRTALIASTHRVYAISEKSAMGDGLASSDRVLNSARKSSLRFVGFDMETMAAHHRSVISATLFGALAGSGALPLGREAFEQTIRDGGIAVDTNLAAFGGAFDAASAGEVTTAVTSDHPSDAPSKQGGVLRRIAAAFPEPAHDLIEAGAKRCADYQDRKYAEEYLDRLTPVYKADQAAGGAAHGFLLTQETARHLALWMTYEDVIRVADLKTRRSRFERFRSEVRAAPDQIVHVAEYLHPRVEEIADVLPAPLGAFVLSSNLTRRLIGFVFSHGRRISTTKLFGFLLLYSAASLRPLRRISYRFREEKKESARWLDRVASSAASNYLFAVEIARCQRLIKGYGDTYARGLKSFNRIKGVLDELARGPSPAEDLKRLQDAALKDDSGAALDEALAAHKIPSAA